MRPSVYLGLIWLVVLHMALSPADPICELTTPSAGPSIAAGKHIKCKLRVRSPLLPDGDDGDDELASSDDDPDDAFVVEDVVSTLVDEPVSGFVLGPRSTAISHDLIARVDRPPRA